MWLPAVSAGAPVGAVRQQARGWPGPGHLRGGGLMPVFHPSLSPPGFMTVNPAGIPQGLRGPEIPCNSCPGLARRVKWRTGERDA